MDISKYEELAKPYKLETKTESFGLEITLRGEKYAHRLTLTYEDINSCNVDDVVIHAIMLMKQELMRVEAADPIFKRERLDEI